MHFRMPATPTSKQCHDTDESQNPSQKQQRHDEEVSTPIPSSLTKPVQSQTEAVPIAQNPAESNPDAGSAVDNPTLEFIPITEQTVEVVTENSTPSQKNLKTHWPAMVKRV